MPDTSVAAQQLALAQKYAAASQAPALALIRDQQARQDAANAARGQSIQGFATAAANLAKGDAAAVQAPFDTAAHTQAGFGAGYSGQMQGAINSDAANSNDFLAKIGSPQHVNAPQAGDAVYHMGGVVPATALSTAGAGFGAAAGLQPGNIMARGQQDYSANAFKGADADQTFADQIKTLAAQNPKVVRDFLTQLQTASRADAAAQLNQDRFNADYGKGGFKDRAANKPNFFGSAAGGYYAFDPSSGTIKTVVAGTGPSPQAPKIVGSDKTGRFAYDPNTGTMTPLIPALKSSPKADFTPMQISRFKNQAATAAKFAWQGEYDAKKQTWLSQPQRYMDALATMVDHGIPPNIAENSLNRFWSRPGYGAEVDARMKWVEGGMKGTVPTIKTDAARPSRPLYSGKAGAAAKTAAYSPTAGGFLPQNASYTSKRADQGRDLQTAPGGPIVAPGDGVVVRVASDPGGGGGHFGPSYPIVKFTSGPYAGQTMYVGHTTSALKPGQQFTAGSVLSYTGRGGPESGGAPPGWAEIGYAPGGTPGKFGQQPPF